MIVRCSEGRKLGRVLSSDERGFAIEKGFFFVTDYQARYEDVTEIAGDQIRLSRPRQELAHAEHTLPREGGLGESVTLGIAGDLATDSAWARAAGEAEWGGRGARVQAAPADEDESGARHVAVEEPGAVPLAYGD